jgi:hypothetical protein
LGLLLEASSDIHTISYNHLLPLSLDGVEVHESFSGLDSNAYCKWQLRRLALCNPARAGVGCAQGALLVVGMSDRCTEDREDGVADVLLDRAALLQNKGSDSRERLSEHTLCALRAKTHGQVCRPDNVDEETGD